MIINKIEKIEERTTTENDILRISGKNLRVLSYEELEQYRSFDDLFRNVEGVALLYQTKKNFGHWVGLQLLPNRVIEFFDPYGNPPDANLLLSDYYYRNSRGGESLPHLSALIEDILDDEKDPYKIIYNAEQLQKFEENTNTCGRWVAVRFRLQGLDLNSFIDLFYNPKKEDPDFWVSAVSILL